MCLLFSLMQMMKPSLAGVSFIMYQEEGMQ